MTTQPAPRPHMARLLAAVPFVAVGAGASAVAARIMGCANTEQLLMSLPIWTAEFNEKRRARRAETSSPPPPANEGGTESALRSALEAPGLTGRSPLPFDKLTRAAYLSMAPETRRILHRHATRQMVNHPEAPVPEWIHDDPATS